MKFLKNNMWTLASLLFVFTFAFVGDAAAVTADSNSVFGTAFQKISALFRQSKLIIFLIGGFGLIALAFQAIFGKIKWNWFAALAFGLAIVAAAGAIVNYATQEGGVTDSPTTYDDSLK